MNRENAYTVCELDNSIAIAMVKLCATMATLNAPVTTVTTLNLHTSFHHLQQD